MPRIPRGKHIQQSNPVAAAVQFALDYVGQCVDVDCMSPRCDILPIFTAGTFAFYATAFSSQCVQQRFLRISTGTRPAILPITVGAVTVALGSWMGHLAGLGTSAAWETVQSSWKDNTLMENIPKIGGLVERSIREMTRPMFSFAEDANRLGRGERKEAWMHAARICVLGLVTYKAIFRSRFSSLSPSSYTARGSFARVGIPASPNFNYATRLQREKLERIGRWFGCHTCGSRMIFSDLKKNTPRFHGDHIPPVSVAKQLNGRWYRQALGWKVPQKFYPQCRNCSNKQGGMLSKAVNAGHRNLRAVGGGKASHFHGRRLRIGHLTGGAVAVLSVGKSGGKDELVGESRLRVRSFQDWMEDLGRKLKERICLTQLR